VLTQPVTEMSTRNLPGLGLTTSAPSVSLDRLLQGQLYRIMHFKKTRNYDQFNIQCTCYLCVGSAGMASAKNVEFLGEQG
jgi:hypothetical protein